MSFGGLILTNQGRNRIAAAISSEKALDFTHVQLGDGVFNGSYPSKKELTNMIMEIPVTRVARRDSEVTIDCDWNSSQAPKGFYFREIGLIGNGALCYYDNAGTGEAEYIDPESETVSKEKRIRLTVVVSDDVNIKVHTASSLYALATELDELDKKKIDEEDVHDWVRQPEKPAYNKEEIGLGNVDNTADKDKPLSTAMKEAIQDIYEQATAFAVAKIAELINGAPATADTLKELADLIADNRSVVDALDAAIGKKANQSELDTHVNNSTIHFTSSERTKLSGIAAGANKYTHPASAVGAKASGLYKITTDAAGHVTGAAAVTKADITGLGIPGANTTYSTGTASVAGLTKLYTSTGTSTDGTMTRSAITNALNGKAATSHSHRSYSATITGTNSNSVFTFMKENITTSTSASLFVLIVVKLGAHILLGAMTYAGGYHFYTIYKDSNYINAELNASNNITVSGPAGTYTFFSIVLSS